ncbi:uncharacterized protein B0T23DRAFT_403787 [Neurospora hispaniola]|uniref:Uncharacterized protein n=1 Tax=Neurospora hispaniola TaxID=588809 RepID=A0AAJ0MSQ2_9PEZI|nr:hypothetical protein B0T23DRAFT_403787 [Neurospora hispaniola]
MPLSISVISLSVSAHVEPVPDESLSLPSNLDMGNRLGQDNLEALVLCRKALAPLKHSTALFQKDKVDFSPVLFQSPDCLGGRSGVCLAADLSPYWHGSPCLLPTAAVDATAAAVARSGYHGFLHRESPSADLNLDLDSHSSTRPSIPVIQSSS